VCFQVDNTNTTCDWVLAVAWDESHNVHENETAKPVSGHSVPPTSLRGYAFYAFHAWRVYFPQSGALAGAPGVHPRV
jgi:hypothetical protein